MKTQEIASASEATEEDGGRKEFPGLGSEGRE
jgi:hypothetical protein